MNTPQDILIFICACTGLIIALYFTLIYYGLISPEATWLPTICRMDEKSCSAVIHAPAARVLKIAPNFIFGIIYYVLCIITRWVDLHISTTDLSAHDILLMLSWSVVGLSLYLLYDLFFVIKMNCPLCFTAHALNITIALTLTFGY